MARQVELADDLRPQQRHDVRADRELEAGEDLLGDRGAAEHVPALEHEHLAARARQVGGAGQPVVAAADDDRVVSSRLSMSQRRIARRPAPIVYSARADRNRLPRAHARALREPQLPRLVGLLRRQRLRDAPRARVQRHPQRRALIDISPLFKYRLTGPDATRLVDRVITRDASTHGASARSSTRRGATSDGKVIDDGTVTRLAEQRVSLDRRRPEPALVHRRTPRAWTSQIEDISEQRRRAGAAGPDLGAAAARRSATPTSTTLKYFRVDERHDRRRAGRHLAHRLHRRPRLRDLDAVGCGAARSGTRSSAAGAPFDLHPAGMLALDVARVEAGLLLIDVDFHSSRKALIDSQKYSPFEMGLGRLVDLDEGRRSSAARRSPTERRRGHRAADRRARSGLDRRRAAVRGGRPAAAAPAAASRVAVPVYKGRSAGRPRDVDHVVADAEEADRAGHGRRAALRDRDAARDGSDGRSGPPPRRRPPWCRRRSSIRTKDIRV